MSYHMHGLDKKRLLYCTFVILSMIGKDSNLNLLSVTVHISSHFIEYVLK